MKSEGNNRQRIRAAYKTLLGKGKLEATRKRLDTIRGELELHILVSVKEKLDLQAVSLSSLLGRLDEESRRAIEAIVDNRRSLEGALQARNAELCKRQDNSDLLASERHEEVLTALKTRSASTNSHPGKRKASKTYPKSKADIKDVEEEAELWPRILAWLDFRSRTDRQEEIAPAHRATFEWIFCDPLEHQKPWSHFKDWLISGSGIYWINGKAGSGKSTLMKFVARDSRTLHFLKHWAGHIPLVMASFYFWNHGTEMQKSLKGLLQSLLYQAVQHQPELIPAVFPEIVRQTKRMKPDKLLPSPTYSEVRIAFRRLMTQTQVSVRLFLLIDGLDEYEASEGEVLEMAELFKTVVVSNPNIKLFVSSRPLAALKEAFHACPKLRLQDLTETDIRTYIADKVAKHERMVELKEKDPLNVAQFIGELVAMASGVFLWVKLVVRSLLAGLGNLDRISDLQERLRELPQDLKDLYWHMLRRVPPPYRKHASRLIHIVHYYNFHRAVYGDAITAIALSFADEADPAYALKADVCPLTNTQLIERYREIECRIISRCLGLLEIHHMSRHDTSEKIVEGDTWFLRSRVQFLHRSVLDFLHRPEVWNLLQEEAKRDNFNVNVALLQSCLLQIKTWAPPNLNSRSLVAPLWDILYVASEFSRLAEDSTGKPQTELLDELDRVMTQHHTSAPIPIDFLRDSKSHSYEGMHWTEANGYRPQPWYDSFLAFAVRQNLRLYVQAKLDIHGPSIIQKRGQPLLDYAICRFHRPNGWLGWHAQMDVDLVRKLLKNGADPNAKFEHSTPWRNALTSVLRWHSRDKSHKKDLGKVWIEVLDLLVRHGADPNVVCEETDSSSRETNSPSRETDSPSRETDSLSREPIQERRYCSSLRVIRKVFIDVSPTEPAAQVLYSMLKLQGAKDQECLRDGDPHFTNRTSRASLVLQVEVTGSQRPRVLKGPGPHQYDIRPIHRSIENQTISFQVSPCKESVRLVEVYGLPKASKGKSSFLKAQQETRT